MIGVPLALARLSDLKRFAANRRIVTKDGASAYRPEEIQEIADLLSDIADLLSDITYRLAQK